MIATSRNASSVVDRVLLWIERNERAASLRNNQPEVFHWRDVWRAVFDANFSRNTLPVVTVPTPNMGKGTLVVAERPVWWKLKYSRPLRRVVKRTERVLANSGVGSPSSVRFDVLECGHKVQDHSAMFGQLPAKHRRCRECVRHE